MTIVAVGSGTQFAVLGPVGVRRPDGASVRLRSPLRRRLLAVLLAHPFEELGADRLADEIWFGEAPLDRTALHIQVCRLRKQLAEASGGSDGTAAAGTPITTGSSGYRFVCERDDIDWVRFVDRLDGARRLRAAGRDTEANTALHAGLQLWRDDAFCDLVGTPLIDERARQLDGLRRTALADWARGALADGDASAVSVELAAALEREPFDETVATLLVRAQCRQGRADLALATGRRTLAALRNDLGVTPSPPFARLVAAIGSGDPSLALDPYAGEGAPTPGSAPGNPPLNLPGTVAGNARPAARPSIPVADNLVGFAGRSDELETVTHIIGSSEGPALVEVVAPGGFGKTRFGAELAGRLTRSGTPVRLGRADAGLQLAGCAIRECFADLVDIDRIVRKLSECELVTAHELAGVIVGRLVAALDTESVSAEPGQSGGQGGPAHSDGLPVVVIVDDLHAADTLDRLVLTGLLESRSGSDRPHPCGWHPVVIGLSRRPGVLPVVPEGSVRLNALDERAIVHLVGDPALAVDLERCTNGHPLLVAHAASRLLATPPDHRTALLNALATRGGEDDMLGRLVAERLDRCSAVTVELVRLLAVADAPLPLDLIQAATRLSERAAARATVDGVEAGLVVERPDGTLTLAGALTGAAIVADRSPQDIDDLAERLSAASARTTRSPATASPSGWIPGDRSPAGSPVGVPVDMMLAAGATALRNAAFDEAFRIAELASNLCGDTDHHLRARASCLAGAAAWATAERSTAQRWYRRALADAEQLGDDALLAEAVLGLLGPWNSDAEPPVDTIATLDRVTGLVGDPARRSVLLSRKVSLLLGRHTDAPRWAEEAERLAHISADESAVLNAVIARSYANLGRPGHAKRLRAVENAARHPGPDVGPDRQASIVAHYFVAACEADARDDADWCADRQRLIATQTGRPLQVWRSAVFDATNAMLHEEPDRAIEAVERAGSISRRHRLPDGLATETLQRALLAVVGPPGYAGFQRVSDTGDPVRLGDLHPHPLTHALDALLLAERRPEIAATSVARAASLLADAPADYLLWASAAATREAAIRLDDNRSEQIAAHRLSGCDVIRPVVAMGTGVLPGWLPHPAAPPPAQPTATEQTDPTGRPIEGNPHDRPLASTHRGRSSTCLDTDDAAHRQPGRP